MGCLSNTSLVIIGGTSGLGLSAARAFIREGARLVLAPDCGLSQTARWAARQKLSNMVEGVRQEKGLA